MTDRRITKHVFDAIHALCTDPEASRIIADAAVQAYEEAAASIPNPDEPSRFVVKGSSVFPIDMLRHDHCWPVSGDFNRINFKPLGAGEATIELCAQSARCITPLRWASFGWTVTEVGGVAVEWKDGRPYY